MSLLTQPPLTMCVVLPPSQCSPVHSNFASPIGSHYQVYRHRKKG